MWINLILEKSIKYCEKDEFSTNEKNGYKQSQRDRFKIFKGDVWL